MGVSGGVWECGKPERFSIISMPQSEGEKGEVTFSLLSDYSSRFSSLPDTHRPAEIQTAFRILLSHDC